MAATYYTARVKEGLLLELPKEAQELQLKPGEMVQLHLDRNGASAPSPTPNEKMLAALAEIASLNEGLPFTDGSNTQRLLQEARAGAMYGYDPSE